MRRPQILNFEVQLGRLVDVPWRVDGACVQVVNAMLVERSGLIALQYVIQSRPIRKPEDAISGGEGKKSVSSCLPWNLTVKNLRRARAWCADDRDAFGHHDLIA